MRGQIISRQRVDVGALELDQLAVFHDRAGHGVLVSSASVSSVSASVLRPVLVLRTTGSFSSSNSTVASCLGESMLNAMPDLRRGSAA